MLVRILSAAVTTRSERILASALYIASGPIAKAAPMMIPRRAANTLSLFGATECYGSCGQALLRVLLLAYQRFEGVGRILDTRGGPQTV